MAGLVFAMALAPSVMSRTGVPSNMRPSNPYARSTWRPPSDDDGRTQPPSYSRQHLDRSFSEGQLGDVMRRQYRPAEGDGQNGSRIDEGNEDAVEAEYEATEAFSLDMYNRMSLTFDKTLIYPTHPPSVALYYLPQPLDDLGEEISLELSVSPLPNADGTRAPARAEELYKMSRGPMWPWPHGPEYLIKPQREGCCVAGVAKMTRSKSMTGSRWSILYRGFSQDSAEDEEEPRLCEIQYANNRWTHRRGSLLATEEQSRDLKILVFQGSIVNDKPLQDLLVSAWCVRLWHKMSPGPLRKRSTEPATEELAADTGRRWSLVRRGTR